MNIQRVSRFAGVLLAGLAGSMVTAHAQNAAPAASPAATSSPVPSPAAAAAPPAAIAPDMNANQRRAVDSHLDDWAQLKRYAADNAALPPPAKGEKRVVFYGDSITDGWGRRYSTFFPGKPYVNRGISGQTTPQMLVRFRQDVIDLHPAAVVILAGTNDIAGNSGPETLPQIENNLRSMAELARANGIRVVLASVLPVSRYTWRADLAPAETIRTLNAWIQDYCAREHMVYLDYYDALVNADGGMKQELAADKLVHPNAAGYEVMAPLAEAAITKALASH